VTSPTPPQRSSAPLVVRLGLGLLLGALALLVNHFAVPLLSEETPKFIFGGALVLVAYVRLGPEAGVLAAIVSIGATIARFDGRGAAALTYVAMWWATTALSRRARGLVPAALCVWLAAGWAIDLLAYGLGVGLSPDYLALLFLKQLFNATIDAILAELLLRLPLPGVLGPSERDAGATPLRAYAFNRVLLAVMAPMTFLALTYTRAEFREVVSRAEARSERTASNASMAVAVFLRERREPLQRLARRLEQRVDPAAAQAMLDAFAAGMPGYLHVTLVDSAGVVLASTPASTRDSAAHRAMAIGEQPYFHESRETLETAYAPLILARGPAAPAGSITPIVAIAEPLVTSGGRFAGLVVGAIDGRALAPRLSAARSDAAEVVSLFDAAGRLITSLDTRARAGMPLAGLVAGWRDTPEPARTFVYYPPADGSVESRYHIDPRHAAYHLVPPSGWRVLVDLPSHALHAAMRHAALQVLGVTLALLALLYAAIALVARRLAAPLRRTNEVATAIAHGGWAEDEQLALLGASPIEEVSSLVEQLRTMQRALAAKHAESAAREEASEQRFRATFEQAAVGVVHLGLEGDVLRVNQRFAAIAAHERDALLGHRFESLLHPDDVDAVRRQIAVLRSGARATFSEETRVRRHDGSLVWVQLTGSRVHDAEGEAHYFIVVAEDIGVRKELEHQLLQAQKMEAIGQLAGGIAHDFNNLLTPILAYSDLVLAEMPRGTSLADDVEQIRRAAERARALTQQLLAFGRRQVLEMRVVDLGSVVEQFLAMFRPILREDVAIDVRVEGPLWSVRADAVQIEQILMNLAVNAVDAMPAGGRLSITASNVTLATAPSGAPGLVGRCVRLAVRDTGVGIPPDAIAHLFEPFFTTKARGRGTGLGLATVYGIVRQHGGDVTVRSDHGRGATFTLLFPAASASAEPLGVPAARAALPDARRPRGETVLVAEDERAVRELVSSALQRHGYTVLSAANPPEALRLLEGDPAPRLDLLVTDVIMPSMNGRELLERLRATRPDLPALFISGYPGDVIASHGVLDAGVNLLHKPFAVDELLRRVRVVLGEAAVDAAR
jgi:PAS domain S-box-containing protein